MDAERKLATVVFADLTGSTELAAAQDPERTRAMLERFYDAMAQEIAAAGGTIEKFAGDAVMAAFGVPVAHEDHVERALHAALAMQRRLDELFDGKLTLRVGVNCGEVVFGEAREGSSFVTGDAVNVAARLEQLAEPGEILVGERAAAIVSGAFEFEAPQTLQAKGKPEGVACRRLVRALSLMRPRGVPGLRSPFVGRDGELAAVQRAYEQCGSVREAQLVTVMGEAGVGKSRLVRELWQWLGRSAPGSLRRVGRCPPYGHAVTYQPLAEIVKEHFGILDSDPPERILALLGEREILAIALGLDVAGDLHPVVARDRLHDAWVDLVQTLASERPLVMLVEDLHWAEEPLLELLERMLRDVPGPVLLVGTARPEFLDRSPTWGRGRVPSEWIWLEALQPDEVRRLLEQAAEAEVPPTVQEFLGQAEGNPLFLEELVSKLIEGGALRPGEGWNPVLVPEDGGVPESVQSVLASRIDLLPPAEKRALQAAAVIGRVFWSGALGRLLGGVDPNLRLLEQRDFIRRRGASSLEGEREFAFKHAITREVGYRSLTLGDRARLHAEFALWLLGRGGGRDEDAALLALHYGEAARPENADLAWGDDPMQLQELRSYALSWLRRAAELARGRYEAAEALALLTQALAYAEDDTTRIELQREIAYTHSFRYDPEGLRAALESALELGPDPAITAEIYGQLAYYALVRPYMWKQPPSRELGESWLAKAFDLSSESSEARAYALLARAFSQPGRVNEAKEAYAIGEALGQPRLNALACEAQMLAATAAGHHTEACRWAERSLDVAMLVDDPGLRAYQFWNATFAYLRAGRIAGARPLAVEADRLTSSLTPHDRVHGVAGLVLVESISGNWPAVAELAQRAEATTAANQSFPCQFNWRNLLVCAYGLARSGAADSERRLEKLGREGAHVAGPAEREPVLLRLALLRGEVDECRRLLEALPASGDPFGIDAAAARLDAFVALGESSRVEEEAAAYLDEASYTRPFALRALGAVRQDESLIDRAASQFEEMGLRWRVEETRALLAR